MPWNKVELMSQREEFIKKALLPGSNISALCRSLNISRKTAYKWLSRYDPSDLTQLLDQSKAPKICPHKISKQAEEAIISAHEKHPYWGARKLRNYLLQTLETAPSSSTIDRVLKRNHCEVIKNNKSQPSKIRFERERPNELWQMDFKGHFMTKHHRCYPLSILDDYSRYSIGLVACRNEKKDTVKACLITCFKEYGLPDQINVDNGNPWGKVNSPGPTQLAVWLMKQGIRLTHSSPYHPQTNGKVERFHRTLKLEVLHERKYNHCDEMQRVFDEWLHVYNYERPHDALSGAAPSSRYQCSNKEYSDRDIEFEYDSKAVLRKVHKEGGTIRYQGKRYGVGKGLAGEWVAIRETANENEVSIFFMDHFIRKIKLQEGFD